VNKFKNIAKIFIKEKIEQQERLISLDYMKDVLHIYVNRDTPFNQ
jgi:hypothetical protein